VSEGLLPLLTSQNLAKSRRDGLITVDIRLCATLPKGRVVRESSTDRLEALQENSARSCLKIKVVFDTLAVTCAEVWSLLRRLNRILYFPPPEMFIVNVVIFAVAITLAVIYGFFSQNIQSFIVPLSKTDGSPGVTVSVLLLGLAGAFALIYGKTRTFFLCRTQCIRATFGTTLIVSVMYAIVWGVIQIVGGHQRFVLLHPEFWSGQETLNNLKYGSMLFLFSSVSLVGSLAVSGGWSSYDFAPFLADWTLWRRPVQKLSQNTPLSENEHKQLLAATASMLTNLAAVGGHVQPVAKTAMEGLVEPLSKFDEWYKHETDATYANCKGLNADIRDDTLRVLKLC
jgi:hypothetical protein